MKREEKYMRSKETLEKRLGNRGDAEEMGGGEEGGGGDAEASG